MAKIVISIQNGMPSVTSELDRRNAPVNLSTGEKEAVDIILRAIENAGFPTDKIHLERRTENYLTIVAFDVFDFCRIKIGTKAKWISLDFSKEDRELLGEDPRLDIIKSPHLLHWKLPLDDVSDISRYTDFIVHSYQWSGEREKMRFSRS